MVQHDQDGETKAELADCVSVSVLFLVALSTLMMNYLIMITNCQSE